MCASSLWFIQMIAVANVRIIYIRLIYQKQSTYQLIKSQQQSHNCLISRKKIYVST